MLAVACMALIGLVEVEDDWVAAIRDAQIANIALLDQGHATFEMRWKPSRDKPEARLRGEAWWRGDDYRLRWQLVDREGFVSGRISDDRPIQDQPWEHLLRNPKECLRFDSASNRLMIAANDRNMIGVYTLQFRPRDNWFVSGTPMGGRPWPEMVGLVIPGEGGKSSTNEYVRRSNEVVRQVRRDPDGGVLEVDFSIRDATNPVLLKYRSKDKRLDVDGAYRWRQVGDASVLLNFEITRGFIHPETKRADESHYRLDVKVVELALPPDSTFDRREFMKLANPDTTIDDRLRGRSYKARVTTGIPDSKLDGLADELRSKGPAERR